MLTAMRYLAFNPVRARLSRTPEDWPWSSARAHLEGRGDGLAAAAPVLELAPRFRDLLELSPAERTALDGFETRSANGRPLGDEEFLASIERRLGRVLARKRPGRKKREEKSPANWWNRYHVPVIGRTLPSLATQKSKVQCGPESGAPGKRTPNRWMRLGTLLMSISSA